MDEGRGARGEGRGETVSELLKVGKGWGGGG